MPETSAATDYLVGLIGSGIAPSLTPALHEREADELGLRYLYRRLDIDALGLPPTAVGDLLSAARLTGYRGLNITHPCKQLVLPFLDELSAEARALGAVNTVVFEADAIIGHNTDAPGFAAGLRRGLPGVRMDKLVQLGAGGAGSAVAHALLGLGAGTLTLHDAEPSRAHGLAAALTGRFGPGRAVVSTGLADAVTTADGLVNATPVGMWNHPGLPLPAELLRPGLWVADVVYRPLDTELVRTARELGAPVLTGGPMAVFQAAHAFALFTGREPDTDRMLRHFDTLTTPTPRGRHDAFAHS
ncbi:MAG TPA: shikimate dehydrogenase [Pseudonocardiaceae bacterium]|nr:shikimate dehydrogenase [Pseudonocardiaceae bacterium]